MQARNRVGLKMMLLELVYCRVLLRGCRVRHTQEFGVMG
jgi:hypothetical protein